MTVHAVAGRRPGPQTPAVDAMILDSDDPDVLADASQVAGHILGRIVRMRLMQAVHPAAVIDDMAAYLVGRDLAQRRLIDVVPGL